MKSGVLAFPLILFVLASPVAAQVEWGLFRVFGGLGLVSPNDIDSAIGFEGGARVANINMNLSLDARLMYWSSSESSGAAEADFSDFAFLPGGTYRFDTEGSITPLARAGLGIHRFKAEASFDAGPFGTGTVEGTDTELGIYLGGGAEFEAGDSFNILAIAEFHVMDAEFLVLGAEAHYLLP